MNEADMRELLAEGLAVAAKKLVEKIKEGTFCAADLAQLRGMYKDAGGSLMSGGRATPLGDEVLDSLSNVDLDMLN